MSADTPTMTPTGWAERWAWHAWQRQPTLLALALQPFAWLYTLLAALHRGWWRWLRRPTRLPVPVVVVGNLTVGGAGKTPVVIALVQTLQAAGYTPAVISRGYGRRQGTAAQQVRASDNAESVGDEPLLIHRRTGAPVAVGAQRVDAAQLLLAERPDIDVIVSDDGLQHHALAHDMAVVVLDPRGVGNGLRLPAGPLRQPVPAQTPPHWLVLGSPATASAPPPPLPCAVVHTRADRALPLQAWWAGLSDGALDLAALAGRPLVALAGLGNPGKFFAMLQAAGLTMTPCPRPDHARYAAPPWPPSAREVITTEKDAVKLSPGWAGEVQVWVVPLDLTLPQEAVGALLQRLPPPHRSRPSVAVPTRPTNAARAPDPPPP